MDRNDKTRAVTCIICGQPFEPTHRAQTHCPDCRGKTRRTCEACGKSFVTSDKSPRRTCSPECAYSIRSTKAIFPRVCRQCGATFDGGPRAWYCPTCRAERSRSSDRESKARARAGKTRRIGSISRCERCGKEYTVAGSLQRYCPTCGPIALREKDNAASRAWNAAHPARIREIHAKRKAPAHFCRVCGAYIQGTRAVTCSPRCRRLYLRAVYLRADMSRH